MPDTQTGERILVTGATGYVGGQLLTALKRLGRPIRCLVRDPRRLETESATGVEVVAGDVLRPDTLGPAVEGIEVAYYLVHSMGKGAAFEEHDRQAAENFADAAVRAGVQRIVYLGGLADTSQELSRHLRSRIEVGEILRGSGVPTIELRASIIIGHGSLSFEILRSLIERLPMMTTPRWVRTLCQPIYIGDLVEYLVMAAGMPFESGTIVEVGGADQVSYLELMREYGRRRGLRRLIVPVPVLTPYLSSLWLALVTPMHFRVGRRLIESLGAVPTVVRNASAQDRFGLRPKGAAEAIERALADEDAWFDEMRWVTLFGDDPTPPPFGGHRVANRRVETHSVNLGCPCSAAFSPIERIGGDAGWYYGSWLWSLRGMVDRLLGGPGLRVGRQTPEALKPGDVVDFWTVDRYEPGQHLRLSAEMKLPGRAWLDFETTSTPEGCVLRQTAVFDPVGLLGLLYWHAVYPVHGWLFRGMLRSIAKRVIREWRDEDAGNDE